MSISKFSRAFVVAILASASAVDALCTSLPARTGVGRGSSAYDDKSGWCKTQIDVCGLICIKSGGQVKENSCTVQSNTAACYECSCTFPGVNGIIIPDLTPYAGTIPSQSCQQSSSNCWSAPGGGVNNGCEGKYNCGERKLEGYYAEQPVPIPGVPTNLALPVTSSTFPDYNTKPAATPTPAAEPEVTVPATTSEAAPVAAPEPTTSSSAVVAVPASTSEVISSTSLSVSSTSSAHATSSTTLSSSIITSTLSTLTSTAFSNSTISTSHSSSSSSTRPSTTSTRRGNPTGLPSALPTNSATKLQMGTFMGGSAVIAGLMMLI